MSQQQQLSVYATLRQRNHSFHQVEGDHHYPRHHPAPLQIPSSTHPANAQHISPTTHHIPPMHSLPPLRPHPDLPMSSLDRTSPAALPQPARRHSDPSQSNPAQPEKPPQPGFDPLIISATESALAPVRGALDTVWTLAVTNMRLSMNKMNNDFTYLATQERQKNSHLATKLLSLENQLQNARQEASILKKERQDLQDIIQAYKDENRKLHAEKDHWEIERRILTGMDGRRASSEFPQLDMNKVLGAVTEQVSRQMEQKMSAIINQIELQKSLATQPEPGFGETLQHLDHIQNRGTTEPSPTLQQSSSSPYILPQSPSYQTGSHSPTSTHVVSPISPNTNVPTNISNLKQDGADDASTPISTASFPPKNFLKDTSSTPTGMQSADSLVPPHTSPVPTQNLLRRTSSFDQQPRKKPRLTDGGRHSPNFPSSSVISITQDIKSDHDPEPQPENAPSAMQTTEQELGDWIHGEYVSTSPTVKPEEVDMDMDIKGSKDATPASSPVPSRRSTPKPHYRTVNIPRAPSVGQRNTKLGIGHIDLLYRTDNGIMTCRMCLSRSRDLLLSRDRSSKVAPVKKFEQEKATWDELISHCRSDHPKTCRDLERLGPTQIAEMKQRLMSGERSSVSRG